MLDDRSIELPSGTLCTKKGLNTFLAEILEVLVFLIVEFEKENTKEL